jgi:hypothetical protein
VIDKPACGQENSSSTRSVLNIKANPLSLV